MASTTRAPTVATGAAIAVGSTKRPANLALLKLKPADQLSLALLNASAQSWDAKQLVKPFDPPKQVEVLGSVFDVVTLRENDGVSTFAFRPLEGARTYRLAMADRFGLPVLKGDVASPIELDTGAIDSNAIATRMLAPFQKLTDGDATTLEINASAAAKTPEGTVQKMLAAARREEPPVTLDVRLAGADALSAYRRFLRTAWGEAQPLLEKGEKAVLDALATRLWDSGQLAHVEYVVTSPKAKDHSQTHRLLFVDLEGVGRSLTRTV